MHRVRLELLLSQLFSLSQKTRIWAHILVHYKADFSSYHLDNHSACLGTWFFEDCSPQIPKEMVERMSSSAVRPWPHCSISHIFCQPVHQLFQRGSHRFTSELRRTWPNPSQSRSTTQGSIKASIYIQTQKQELQQIKWQRILDTSSPMRPA